MSTTPHLDARTLAALAAGATPSPEEQTHVNDCATCRAEIERLGSALGRLESMAARHAYRPGSRLRLPEKRSASPFRLRLVATGLGTAAVAATLAILLLGRTPTPAPVAHAPVAETAFAEEISRLADDPLPDFYQELLPDTDMSSRDVFPVKQPQTPDNLSGEIRKGRLA